MLMIDEPVMFTLGGASSENSGARDDEPTCVHSTVLFSHAASNSGYQCLVWMLGMFSASGFSEKVTA